MAYRRPRTAIRLGLGLLALMAMADGASAQATPYYQGKTISIISGSTGGYDTYARLLATHMKRYIPGTPIIIVKNMLGAGGMLAANHVYNVAAPDGLTFGAFVRTIPLAPLLGNKAAMYRPEKYTWIGTSSIYLDDAFFLIVSKRLGLSSIAQLQARKEPLLLGSSGVVSQTGEAGSVIGSALGINFRTIPGYKGSLEVVLALHRGEVDGTFWGISSMRTASPEWLKPDGPVTFLVQFGYGGESRHPAYPNVPRVDELANTDEQKGLFDLLQLPFKLSRPFAGPPGIPPELTAILREAFMRAHTDPDYLRDAKKLGLDVSPRSGQDVADIIDRAIALPPQLIARYSSLLTEAK